jgi:hypothetical protein
MNYDLWSKGSIQRVCKEPAPDSVSVFLGGTCNGSLWRDALIPLLKVSYFNPVVTDWTPECQERELRARKTSKKNLYVITPKLTGTYSIAEVVDDSNKRPTDTILVLLKDDDGEGFSQVQWKSLLAVGELVKKNGSSVLFDLESCAAELNKIDYCPDCGSHWNDHDFGVPRPYCP